MAEVLQYDTNPKTIAQSIVRGLRRKMDLNESQCYLAVFPAYVDGQPDRVIQVVPGNSSPDDGEMGGQTGGGLQRRTFFTLVVWYRVRMDYGAHADSILAQSAEGFLDYMETVESYLALTVLGGAALEPVRYESESPTTVYDPDTGVVRRDLTVSACWRKKLPTVVTLTAADVAE